MVDSPGEDCSCPACNGASPPYQDTRKRCYWLGSFVEAVPGKIGQSDSNNDEPNVLVCHRFGTPDECLVLQRT